MHRRSFNRAAIRRAAGARSGHSERGSIMVLFAIVLVALLLVVGVAVDSGNLYRSQLALQNAADAAAFATINQITTIGYNELERRVDAEAIDDQVEIAKRFSAYLRPSAEKVLRLNASNAGLKNTDQFPIQIDRVEYLPPGHPETTANAAYAIAVTVRRPIQLYILGALPFTAAVPTTITARATTERRIANLAMVLDLSGSMSCPETGPCDCLALNGASGCPATGRRFDALVLAVKEFIQMFQTDRDRIAIVPFDLSARAFTLKQFGEQLGVSGTSSEAEIEAIADAIRDIYQPRAATNVCDGLTEALAELDRTARNESQSLVLFSDGAPTAGRFLFADSVATPQLDQNNLGFGNYDYINYQIEWLRSPQNIPAGQLPFFPGPSFLLNSDTLRGPSLESLSIAIENAAEPPRPTGRPQCHDGFLAAPAVESASGSATAAQAVFSPCITKLEAHVPGQPNNKYGPTTAAGNPFRGWQEMYYHCAVELSDVARQRDGIVYAVGVGDAGASTGADPYQDINDRYNRKDIFMSRLALDMQEARKFSVPKGDGTDKIVEFDYPGYDKYESLPPRLLEEQAGVYLPAQDTTELRLLFKKIARRVLLRLVS